MWVKIRGFRIELGEIEAALSQHPQVRECVLIVNSDQPSNKHLQAYIVLNNQQGATSSELHRFLKEKLPEYMIPSSFSRLEAFPLTPNGKIDRPALPNLGVLLDDVDVFVAPCNPIEKLLASIWVEVLSLEQVGIHNNFFEMGGNSLQAMQLLSRINETFSINLPLRSLFECSTIAEIAEVVQAHTFEQLEDDTLDKILAEVDELLDQDLEKMLVDF